MPEQTCAERWPKELEYEIEKMEAWLKWQEGDDDDAMVEATLKRDFYVRDLSSLDVHPEDNPDTLLAPAGTKVQMYLHKYYEWHPEAEEEAYLVCHGDEEFHVPESCLSWESPEEPGYSDLGVFKKGSWYRIELSYGGPQDYFQVYCDEDGEILMISYHYLDWFDGEHKFIWGDDFKTAARFFKEYYGVGNE